MSAPQQQHSNTNKANLMPPPPPPITAKVALPKNRKIWMNINGIMGWYDPFHDESDIGIYSDDSLFDDMRERKKDDDNDTSMIDADDKSISAPITTGFVLYVFLFCVFVFLFCVFVIKYFLFLFIAKGDDDGDSSDWTDDGKGIMTLDDLINVPMLEKSIKENEEEKEKEKEKEKKEKLYYFRPEGMMEIIKLNKTHKQQNFNFFI